MSVKNIDRLKKVMRSHLCNRCGTCVGLSEGRIVFTDRTGDYRPVVQSEIPDALADTLWEACPGKHFDFPRYRSVFYGQTPNFHEFIGPFYQIGIGYAHNSETRLRAASGGIISAILIWLLQKNLIDGAVVLNMSEQEPWLTQAVIATTAEEILAAAQSKYIISSVNELLPEMQAFKGRLAYVGLPGQVHQTFNKTLVMCAFDFVVLGNVKMCHAVPMGFNIAVSPRIAVLVVCFPVFH